MIRKPQTAKPKERNSKGTCKLHRTLSSLQNLEKYLSFTDQFFVEKPHKEESGKTNAEIEVQSMVSVPIPQAPPRSDPSKSHRLAGTTYGGSDSKQLCPRGKTTPTRLMRFTMTYMRLCKKSLELDYSNQRLADQEEARKKKRKKHAAPRTPFGSLPSLPPPLPPPIGPSGAPGISGASGSSHLPPPPPPLSIGTSGSSQQQGTQELSPTDSLMQDDSIPNEQVYLSDDEDSENDHLPKADSRQDWWKPLPEEERPATPEPAWTIPSFNVSNIENNWASALVSTYETPAENSLLAKTGDMATFIKWYCRQVNKTKLTQADFKGQAYEVVKAFYPNVIHLQYGSKGSNPALSISKMKAASYPDFGLKLLVLEQMWIDDVCTYDISAKYGIYHWWFNRQKFYIDKHDSLSCRKDVRTHMRILSVIRIKAYSRYGNDHLSKIVLRRADF
ncbi:hypothetical protein Tco_0396245 [Tanacetum coccineum]